MALNLRLSRVRTGVAVMRQDCNYQLDTTKLGRKNPEENNYYCTQIKSDKFMGFPLTPWCGVLPRWMCIVSRSRAAWLDCVSEDAWLSTFTSPESVWELQR